MCIYIYIYMEYIRNIQGIFINIYDTEQSETQTQWGGRRRRAPHWKAAPAVLMILHHKSLWTFLLYSLYIPDVFPKYVPYMFPCVFLNLWSQVPYIFPCAFLNLWNQK